VKKPCGVIGGRGGKGGLTLAISTPWISSPPPQTHTIQAPKYSDGSLGPVLLSFLARRGNTSLAKVCYPWEGRVTQPLTLQVTLFGDTISMRVGAEETMRELAARIQKRLEIPDEEFAKWKFCLIRYGALRIIGGS